MKAGGREAILGMCDRFLYDMECARPACMGVAALPSDLRFSLDRFRRAEPMVPELLAHTEELIEAERIYSVRDELPVNPAAWSGPLSTTLITSSTDDESVPGMRVAYSLRRFRSVPPAEVRGRIKPFAPVVVEEHTALMREDGRYEGAHFYYGWLGGAWRMVHAGLGHGGELYAEIGPMLGFVSEHQIFRTMLWHVTFGTTATKASLMVPCDAASALELFKFRELPAGASRRAALLHWVSAHWRRKASDPDEAIRVLAHLRGQERFLWQDGLVVEILPSADDLRRLDPRSRYAREHQNAVAASRS